MISRNQISRNLIFGVVLLLMAVAALGVYGWDLKTRADELNRIADNRPVPLPSAGSTAAVTLVVAYDDDAALRVSTAYLDLPAEPQARALEILRALLGTYTSKPSPHPIAANSEIRDVFFAANGTAVINTNAAFADGHRSSVLGEDLTVLSLVETLTANQPNLLRVKILVDGKERETLAGHADLQHFFDVQHTHEAARELEAPR